MTDFLLQVFSAVTLQSILVFACLGLMIGAFYGYHVLSPHDPPHFPWSLLLVGWAFVGTFALWAVSTGQPFQPAYQVSRAILWAVTCACIPTGRYVRQALDERGRRSR